MNTTTTISDTASDAEKYGDYTLHEMQAVVRDGIRRMEPINVHWRMLESLYRTGAQRELTMLDLNRILPFPVPGAFLRTINMVLPHFTMIINSVANRDPKFVVTPVSGDMTVVERNAKIAKSVLDYFWKRTDSTEALRDATQDMVILGNGFLKVGWNYSEKTVSRTSSDVALETSDIIDAAHEIAAESGMPLDENAINEIVKSVTVTQQLVEIDEPFVEYVSPFDMFMPANARRLDSARWVAQRIRIPVEELKANELFDEEARNLIQADTGAINPSTYAQFEQQEESLPSVFTNATIIEFYDMKTRTISIFQMNSDKMLFSGPLPYDHKYPPFVHLRNFNDGGSRIWSFGDLENVAGIQLMINEIMQTELNNLKRVGNKYFMNKRVITPELTKALMSDVQDAVIPVDLPNGMAFGDIMQNVPRLPTPSDNYYMEDKLQGYMQKILGISDFQAGVIDTSSRVPATAAAAVEGASTTRAIDKLANVEKAAKGIASRMLALCQQFLDNGKAIRIAGPDAVTWLSVTEEEIEGEFLIEVEGGSTSAINPATLANQGQQIINQIVPVLTQLGYDPEPALRAALNDMGLNPDHLLIKKAPEQPQNGPEMGQNQGTPGEMPPGGTAYPPVSPEASGQQPSMMDQLAALGGPPVPAATSGGMA